MHEKRVNSELSGIFNCSSVGGSLVRELWRIVLTECRGQPAAECHQHHKIHHTCWGEKTQMSLNITEETY